MRGFIISDMEGVSGIVRWKQVTVGEALYEEGHRLYTEEMNAAVRGARAAGATFVNIYPDFLGQEAQLSYIQQGFNIHPKPEGYQRIAQRLIASTPIPEPATLPLLAGALLPLLAR